MEEAGLIFTQIMGRLTAFSIVCGLRHKAQFNATETQMKRTFHTGVRLSGGCSTIHWKSTFTLGRASTM